MNQSKVVQELKNSTNIGQESAEIELGAVITNKEKNYPAIGDWKIESPFVDRGKCIGCSKCAKNCPEGTIVMSKVGKKRPIVHYDFCKGCGVCSAVCPVEAISMKLREKQN